LTGETITYQYNNNGCLITEISSVTGTKTYTYDYENRLIGITLPDGTVINYAYSGDGRRISANNNGTVVKYIYDGLLPVAERDNSGMLLASYTRIPGRPGGIGGGAEGGRGISFIFRYSFNKNVLFVLTKLYKYVI